MNSKSKTLLIALFALTFFSHSISGQVFQSPRIQENKKKTTADYLSGYYTVNKKDIGNMKVFSSNFYAEPKNCKFEIGEAVRVGQYVKVYFFLTNTINPPRPIQGLDLNLTFRTQTPYNNGCAAFSGEYDNGKLVQYKIENLSCQGHNNSTKTYANIAPQKTEKGYITLSGVPINVETLNEVDLHFKYSIAYKNSNAEFCYVIQNMPIEQYILNERGINDLDCTVPISKLPKKYQGLYTNIKIESVVNEMDGYTETYVNFLNNYNEVVMTGISYEEGPEKRISQLIIKSSKIYTPEGVYVGMSYEELCKLGAIYYRQWWTEKIRLNNTWFEIPKLTNWGEVFHKRITERHEWATSTKSEDYITKSQLGADYFVPNSKITEFTYDLKTNR